MIHYVKWTAEKLCYPWKSNSVRTWGLPERNWTNKHKILKIILLISVDILEDIINLPNSTLCFCEPIPMIEYLLHFLKMITEFDILKWDY